MPRSRPERRRIRTARGLVLAGVLPVLLPGCYYSLEGTFDPFRCDPACSDGKLCYQGRCVALEPGDGPLSDGVGPDGVADGGLGDKGPTDAPQDAKPPPDKGPVDGPPADTKPPDTGVVPGTWVTIPPTGTAPVTFTVGSPTTEPCREPGIAKETQHQVTLTRAFEIQSTEVTQGQYQTLMKYNPSQFSSCGGSCPVEYVTWSQAAAYCNALSATKGLADCYTCGGGGATVSCTESTSYSGQKIYDCPGYRLPTEAEWEYAYRAGTQTAYYSGANDPALCTGCLAGVDANADQIGWYTANASVTYAGCRPNACGCRGTHPVGQKAQNAWGLFDMAGNVWEWCHDWYKSDLGSSAVMDPWGPPSGSSRVVRGGSWEFHAEHMRAANRDEIDPTYRYSGTGFRCARTK